MKMSEKEKYHVLEHQILTMEDFDCDSGWILDFGGGGEGIIGQIKGERVVAIDRYKGELQEALDRDCQALPIVMDGTDLQFLDNTFPTATAFYSLMYVKSDDVEQIFKEIYRVLKPGGKFLIWDVNLVMPADVNKSRMLVYLNVTLPNGKLVKTGYGTKKINQILEDYVKIAEKVGFKILKHQNSTVSFHVVLQKEGKN